MRRSMRMSFFLAFPLAAYLAHRQIALSRVDVRLLEIEKDREKFQVVYDKLKSRPTGPEAVDLPEVERRLILIDAEKAALEEKRRRIKRPF